MESIFSSYPIINYALTALVGIIIGSITTYTTEKAKIFALKNENKKLVEETEEIKKNHQLDIDKRKYRYESKSNSYKGFFQKLDSLNTNLNIKSTDKLKEILEAFTISCLDSQSDEEYNIGILNFQTGTQSILMESHRDMVKLKHETSEIKLHASDEIILKITELENAYEKLMHECNLLIQNMATIILSGDSSLMDVSQEPIKKQAEKTEIIKNDLILLMRKELNEI